MNWLANSGKTCRAFMNWLANSEKRVDLCVSWLATEKNVSTSMSWLANSGKACRPCMSWLANSQRWEQFFGRLPTLYAIFASSKARPLLLRYRDD